MSQIKSDKTQINKPVDKIYDFLSDFNNFKNLMPEQVSNWQSTKDSCSFNISGIGQLALKIIEKIPNSGITIIPEEGTKIPFTFELVCLLNAPAENQTETVFIFNHEMPAMISMMASRPLQNLVDIFGKKLKEYFEQPDIV
ncbi:MAG: SRPBCC family protein [Bacteroidota bacterium]